MGLSANTVFELEVGGADTNGGSFISTSTGTDYSRQTTAQIAVTNAVAAGTSTITSATASFNSTHVGNGVYLQGGTGSLVAGWYQVSTFVNTTTVTLDRVVAAGTGITLNLGGAFASFGNLILAGWTTGHIAYILNSGTPFVITSASANVSGGWMSTTGAGAVIGYTTNRTVSNTDAPAQVNYGVSNIPAVTGTRGFTSNLAFNGNGQTLAGSVGGASITGYLNCSWTAINLVQSGAIFIKCRATGNSVSIFAGTAIDCEAWANTATPFLNSNFIRCLSYDNTGSTTHGFSIAGIANFALDCIAYGNGGDGFLVSAVRNICESCHAENNAGWGYDFGAGSFDVLANCSAYNNTLGTFSTAVKQVINNFITITAGSVFTNAASADFSLNNIASRGALLRGTGSPSLYPRGLTASFPDIGVSQHQDTGGGGAGQVSYSFNV